MVYLNDKTYARGEEVTLTFTVDAETVRTEKGVTYQATLADFRSPSGYEIRLLGDAPEVEGDKAAITLTGKVEGVGDGDYRARDGVQGRVPGDTVRWEPLFALEKPLGVKGDADQD